MTGHLRYSSETAIDYCRFLLVVLLAICIPFDISVAFILIPSGSIVLLLVADQFHIKSVLSNISEKGRFLTLLFFIHAVWFTLFNVKEETTSYIEKTLPMLLYPIMICSTPIDSTRFKIIIKAFIWTVITSYLMSLVAAIYHYYYSVARWGRPSDFFFHEQFTAGLFDIHPTYYSLFGCLASLLAFREMTPKYRIVVISILTVFLILINARITVVTQILLIFYMIITNLWNGFSAKKLIYVFAVAAIIFFGLKIVNSIYDYPHRKMMVNLESSWQKSYDSGISDGDGGIVIRMAIWRSAVEVIRENLLFGVGLGYEEQYLADRYKNRNQEYLLQTSFNAHNQALSYGIGMGVSGCLILGAFYVVIIKDAVARKKVCYFEFLSIFFIVGLTESVLVRLLGVSTFVFFNTLLLVKIKNSDE